MNESEATTRQEGTETKDDETLVIEKGVTTISEAETVEQRAELEAQRVADEARSQEEAARISAGLKEKPGKVEINERPSSGRATLLGETAKLGATWPVGPGVEKTVRWTGYGLSAIFAGVENWGYLQLKKHKVFLGTWLPFIGPWLVDKAKPTETWRQQDIKAGSKKK